MMKRMYGEPKPAPVEKKFSSTQVNITGRAAEMMKKLAMRSPDHELAADGREDEPHITAKFGLKFQTPTKRLREALANFGPITVTLGKTSLFTNDDADVVKIDVDSPDLHRLNKLIAKVVPTESTHPTYIPHATLFYALPGKGKKYAGDTTMKGHKLTFHHVLFSGRKGHKELLPLTSEKSEYRAR